MKATETHLLNFIQGPKQFHIPLYQRTYSWLLPQCQQLWDDIVRVALDDRIPAHFVGSIVYISEGIYQVAAVPRLLVIDGQQRLTTISLLLAALAKALETGSDGNISPTQIRNYYLLNNDERGELHHKLILTRTDKDTLTGLINGTPISEDRSLRIEENHRFFERRIIDGKMSLDDIYRGLSKLVIVDVSLDRAHDNPQLIFESLNSTGLDLSQSDLIRNYVLMGLEQDHQARLYNQYWYPIEERFGQEEYGKYFDIFMRDYLTLKNGGVIPALRDVYKEFKLYTQITKLNTDDRVADIFRHAMIYARFIRTGLEPNEEIRAILNDIRTLKMEVAYPFLLEVFADYEARLLSQPEVVEILKIVESYVFRRAIVGIPTNSMNKTFATLTRSIDKSRYLESVKAAFMMMDSYRRFPTDEEFWQEFMIKDVYNFRSRVYLLGKLENADRKEWVNPGEYTIEHIMPQNDNLSVDWQEALGPDWKAIQVRLLHMIGNLTLTGYNSEYSDRPFHEKRDMTGGFSQSPLFLNRGLGQLDRWTAETISDRALRLAARARDIWSAPTLPQDILDKYRKPTGEEAEYTLDHFDALEGLSLDLFNLLRRQISNLDPSVREEPKKLYIAYKTTTNFVDIIPYKSKLKLVLNMRFNDINDPQGLCRDITDLGKWGNGDVELEFTSPDQLEYIMYLVRQSFDVHDEPAV